MGFQFGPDVADVDIYAPVKGHEIPTPGKIHELIAGSCVNRSATKTGDVRSNVEDSITSSTYRVDGSTEGTPPEVSRSP